MFKIGDFSKIAQVSIRLLGYYDEIGLLKPAQIDGESGYRYYTVEQLPQLNCILALKELGLSLDQIRRMSAAEEIRGMLLLKRTQIEQAINEEALRLRARWCITMDSFICSVMDLMAGLRLCRSVIWFLMTAHIICMWRLRPQLSVATRIFMC